MYYSQYVLCIFTVVCEKEGDCVSACVFFIYLFACSLFVYMFIAICAHVYYVSWIKCIHNGPEAEARSCSTRITKPLIYSFTHWLFQTQFKTLFTNDS